ncbi:MAG: hypothetical protein L6Q95_14750, partial [Planctomycetes bacterium]|nr:hypothetical protein [Planctomycetota bacterium]
GRVLRLRTLAVAATVLLALGLALYLRGGEAPGHFEAKDPPPSPPAEAQAPAPVDRQEAKGGSALEDSLERDARAAGGVKLGKARGAPEKKEDAADLLAAVARSRRVAPAERKAYLRELAALGPARALEHVRAVAGEDTPVQILERRRDGSPPVLAAIRLEDREEANLVRSILGASPSPAAPAAALAVEPAEDQVTADVRGTPEELARLGRWLALLDLAPSKDVRPRVQVFGEAGRDEVEEAGPQVETAVVKLSFGKPPEPKPEETSPKGK